MSLTLFRSSLRMTIGRPELLLGTILFSGLLASCGGGGGGGVSSATPPPPVTYALSGRIQKGPFAVGATISVNELNAILSPTGKVYNVQTSDALGDFAVSSQIGASKVEIVAQGFYFDELTGKLSASQITLRALSDLSVNSSVTVNVLTTLQEPRLKTLVSQGSTFAAASTQSQKEVLELFGIDSTKVGSLSSLDAMRIDGATDADAALLAASVLLSQMATDTAKSNGTTQAAELSNLVNTIAAQLSANGTVTSPSFASAKILADTEVNPATVASNLQSYYTKNGLTVVAPKFEEWIDRSNTGVLPQRLVPVTNLAFSPTNGVSPGQLITSGLYTVAGLGAGVAVPVTANIGTAIVKNNAAATGAYSVIQDGDTIALQTTSLGYGLKNTSTVSIGSSSASWLVTTRPLSGTITGLAGTGLVLQINGGGDLAIPAGSGSFSFPSTLSNGTAFRVTALTQPVSPQQICSVSNAAGTVGITSTSVSIVCGAPSELVLVATGLGVSVYAVDPLSGSLTTIIGSPFAAGGGGTMIAVSSSHKFVYVLNASSASAEVSAYSINQMTGVLTAVPGSPFATGASYAKSLAIDPSGAHVYVIWGYTFISGGAAGILAYDIDQATGALTPLSGGPFPANGTPYSISFDPAYHYGYAVTDNAGVLGYTWDSTNGSLSPIGNVAPYNQFMFANVAFSPNGLFAYIGGQGYAVDVATGGLTSTSVLAARLGTCEVHPTANFLFCGINSFAIDPMTGALTAIGSGGAGGGTGLTLDPSGNFLYSTDGVSEIIGYAIDLASGVLTPVPGSPFPTGTSPSSMTSTSIQ